MKTIFIAILAAISFSAVADESQRQVALDETIIINGVSMSRSDFHTVIISKTKAEAEARRAEALAAERRFTLLTAAIAAVNVNDFTTANSVVDQLSLDDRQKIIDLALTIK